MELPLDSLTHRYGLTARSDVKACVGLNRTSTTAIGTLEVNSATPALPVVVENRVAS